jgi:hypothetical protein
LACRHNELTTEAGRGAKDETLHMLRYTEVSQQTVAQGHSRRFRPHRTMSALPPKATFRIAENCPRSAANLLTRHEAFFIAVNIAKLPCAAADIEGHSAAAKFSQPTIEGELDHFVGPSGCRAASASFSHSAAISRLITRDS